ncbi:PP2C family protein-serine/threonine phosphatase [Eisenibacter elegans]|uniref:PP2C family protein-serine/threonine phosphatase n=1 Tax=Eisenibacter elegans TaxID=997 RepID=UPI001FDFE004|nr:PP2C family protein-serine/threonine phosphatase [Eisenibacter elegans]
MHMTPKVQQNSDKFRTKFHLIELELNSILEITQAINNNMPEDALYMMYKFTLRANLNIEKLAMYVLEDTETWQCKVNFGTEANFMHIPLEYHHISQLRDMVSTDDYTFQNPAFGEFDLIIPVFHKDRVLAYVFMENKGGVIQDLEKQLDTRFVQTLSNVIIVAVENKKLVRRQLRQEAYKKEMDIAGRVQAGLFPKALPYTDDLQVEASYFPHDLVGGDYYDYLPLADGSFLFCIADVSGKGIPAALLMSNFQASLRTLARQTQDLKQIVQELNYLIYQNSGGDHFITFLLAKYDRYNRSLSYVNAGHNPGFLFAKHQEDPIALDKGTTVLGAFHPLPFLEETTIETLNDFLLVAYTDGITELRNPQGEEFGLDRLLDFMQTQRQDTLSALHQNLIQTINAFKQSCEYVDDITLLSCRVINQ